MFTHRQPRCTEGRLLVVECHLLVGDRVHARDDAKLLFIGPDGVLSAGAVASRCARLLTAPLAVEAWRVVNG